MTHLLSPEIELVCKPQGEDRLHIVFQYEDAHWGDEEYKPLIQSAFSDFHQIHSCPIGYTQNDNLAECIILDNVDIKDKDQYVLDLLDILIPKMKLREMSLPFLIYLWVNNKEPLIDDIISRMSTEGCNSMLYSLTLLKRGLSTIEKDHNFDVDAAINKFRAAVTF